MNSVIYDKLTRFCLYRERCVHEVWQKLYELEVKETDRQKFIDELVKEKYLDEERFVRAFVHDKIYLKKWGHKKIQAELSLKKLPKVLVKKFIEEADDDVYMQNLRSLAEKKWAALYKKDIRERRASLFRYMASKGYESDLITDVLKELEKK